MIRIPQQRTGSVHENMRAELIARRTDWKVYKAGEGFVTVRPSDLDPADESDQRMIARLYATARIDSILGIDGPVGTRSGSDTRIDEIQSKGA